MEEDAKGEHVGLLRRRRCGAPRAREGPAADPDRRSTHRVDELAPRMEIYPPLTIIFGLLFSVGKFHGGTLEWQAKSAGCQTGSPGNETQKKKTEPADPPGKRKKIPYRQ